MVVENLQNRQLELIGEPAGDPDHSETAFRIRVEKALEQPGVPLDQVPTGPAQTVDDLQVRVIQTRRGLLDQGGELVLEPLLECALRNHEAGPRRETRDRR
jgi:hypothetical protein